MLGWLLIPAVLGVIGKREWDKETKVIKENLSGKPKEDLIIPQKKIDLKSFLEGINNYSHVIKESIDTNDWFDCVDSHKLSVLSNGEGASVCLHLPDYTKRSCKPKIADYMRGICEWRRSLSYRSDITTELQISLATPENESLVIVVPDSVTEEFGDDRDPSGTNRMFEALVLNRNEYHERAIQALEDFLKIKTNDNMILNVVIKVDFKNIDNKDLENILNTPLVITKNGEEFETLNILFSSELGSFYDFNKENQVEEYVIDFS